MRDSIVSLIVGIWDTLSTWKITNREPPLTGGIMWSSLKKMHSHAVQEEAGYTVYWYSLFMSGQATDLCTNDIHCTAANTIHIINYNYAYCKMNYLK